MKVVIIGGGIAGLTLGVFLRKKNIDVVVNERSDKMPVKGHAFLMHSEGLSILNELNYESKSFFQGNLVHTFNLRRAEGEEIKHIKLNSWQCFKRSDLIRYLYSLYPRNKIKEGRMFSHFIYEKEKAVAAVFLNGDVEYGDVFIGADGGNSTVRESLFGKTAYTPVKVKEVVGITSNEKVAKTHAGIFTKFQKKESGLSFGFIPTSENEFVWFMQYNPAISDLINSTQEELKSFCKKLLKNFPPEVHDIIDSNNFEKSYIWNTRDFDLLTAFHKQNVVLIGDAAHQSLPFTSAGTTNAILDAKILAQCLEDSPNYEKAFQQFYALRAGEVAKHIELGRELQKLFLSPVQNDDDIPVPLITRKKDTGLAGKDKPIQVLYFTDPICSTCWITQPVLRKLKLEYGDYMNIEYLMGGLLPSWEEFNKGKIRKPSDAAKHWDEVRLSYDMPLDGDLWLEDPLTSSYPPSIAFKAAQLQDQEKAILFLRRIQEMVFIEKKNIVKWEFLKKAAYEVGLDSARLLRDFEGKAQELFKDDLRIAGQLGVTSFPTFFFSDNLNNHIKLKGYHPYESFEEIIFKLTPFEKREKINNSPEKLFTIYPTMTDKEFVFLSNLPKKNAKQILNRMLEKQLIDKYESKSGIIWQSKLDSMFAESSNYVKPEKASSPVLNLNQEKCMTGSVDSNGSCNKIAEKPIDIQLLEREYFKLNSLCDRFCRELKRQIPVIMEKNNIQLAVPVQYRIKDWGSILKDINEERFIGKSSILELDDLIGFRIILLFERDVDTAAGLMRKHFRLLNESKTGDKLEDNSICQVMELGEEWLKIPSFSDFKGLKSEIQTRTLVQHVWAETSGAFQLKHNKDLPPSLKRTLDRISALLETVDLEFGRALDEFESIRQKEKSSQDSENYEEILNVDLLEEILLKKIAKEKKIAEDV